MGILYLSTGAGFLEFYHQQYVPFLSFLVFAHCVYVSNQPGQYENNLEPEKSTSALLNGELFSFVGANKNDFVSNPQAITTMKVLKPHQPIYNWPS